LIFSKKKGKYFFCIFFDFNVVFLCVEKDFLTTEMGVSNEAKNVIPLKFLRKIKNNFFSTLVNSIRGHTVYFFKIISQVKADVSLTGYNLTFV
jgi:hypothetical protein